MTGISSVCERLTESLRQVRADSGTYGELPPNSFLPEILTVGRDVSSALRIMRSYEKNFS